MTQRTNSGATLAFVATSIVIVILIGVAFYFLAQLLGGGRELQHTTDSGSLNVAKQAAYTPSVGLPSSSPNAGSYPEVNDASIVMSAATKGKGINLSTFNAVVGQAMLIAMNADADGSSKATSNAEEFIDLVEASNCALTPGVNSVGKSLQAALSDATTLNTNQPPDQWAPAAFESTQFLASVRMLGDKSQVIWQNSDFKPFYYNQLASDPKVTNVTLDKLYNPSGNVNNLPYTNWNPANPGGLTHYDPAPTGGTVQDPANPGHYYMKGYSPINFSSVHRKLYAVPLETTPHLVALSQVPTYSTQPDAGSVALPPNAFVNGAMALDTMKSHKNLHMLAAAAVGTNSPPAKMQLEYDYIVVDNSGTISPQPIPNPNLDNVFADELMNGITVDSKSHFFSDDGSVEAWEQTARYTQNGTPYDGSGNGSNLYTDQSGKNPFDPNSGPPADHIFNQNGDPLAPNPQSAKQAANQSIPFSPGGNVTCTDTNSDPNGASGGISPCTTMATQAPPSGGSQDIFDHAYHPNPSNPGTQGDTSQLTAAEQSCVDAINYYNSNAGRSWSGQSVPNFSSSTGSNYSGIRLYPTSAQADASKPFSSSNADWGHIPTNNEEYPYGTRAGQQYSGSTRCQITQDGTIVQLVDQTMGAKADPSSSPQTAQSQTVVKLIQQRMAEIIGDPTIAANEYESNCLDASGTARGVRHIPVPIGRKSFIYYDQSKGHFVMSTTAPTHFATTANWTPNPKGIDGRPVPLYPGPGQQYGIAATIADPAFGNNIHERMMVTIDGHNEGYGPTPSSATENGEVQATDQVVVNMNSGAFGSLMNVTFQEFVNSKAGGVPMADFD